jgi:hypothetical protein
MILLRYRGCRKKGKCMIFRILYTAFAFSTLILAACSDSDQQQASGSAAPLEAAAKASSSSKKLSGKPCELLTESMVRKFKSVAADVPIEQKDKSNARFPNCAYRWRVMSEAEEQEAQESNQAKVMENLKAGKTPNDGINFNIPTHVSVRLTAAEFESAEKAQSGLESARSFLVGRAKEAGKKGRDWNAIDGVGDIAYYHRSQMSFTSNRLLMHLDVSPLETAVALANAIIQ